MYQSQQDTPAHRVNEHRAVPYRPPAHGGVGCNARNSSCRTTAVVMLAAGGAALLSFGAYEMASGEKEAPEYAAVVGIVSGSVLLALAVAVFTYGRRVSEEATAERQRLLSSDYTRHL